MTVHRLELARPFTLPEPSALDGLDHGALVAIAERAAALHAGAMARLAVGAARPADATEGDTLLTAEAAAEKLATSTDWLYRHARTLPFTVPLSAQQLRFSAKGIDRWIALRQRAARDR